uniref:M20_dimer domain-containing protein n=1 Tax=Macrostomum lignano TaxID=282301 RepID=A0A1I8HEW9_9PLAT
MEPQQLKDVAAAKIDESHELLLGVSSRLWQNPELALEERMAHQLLTETLESSGFSVTRHFVLDTGFKAEFGSAGAGRPHIAVMCEFDALPGIGHACGHNLIAEVAVGAGLGIKAAMEAGGLAGRVTVLGTPAEEAHGGKIDMIRSAFFTDVDVAMMAHPYKLTVARPRALSIQAFDVTFTGKASHAAGSPWEGLNALDAAVTAYQSVSNLRQEMRPDWRVHGIVKEGGQRPNIIPERAAEFGSAGAGRPHIAVMCEFDALPGIGHACGHNLIAEVAVGAGLGIKAAMEAGGLAGRVTVLGTPAEEAQGGKINMINAGFFKDVDVALMAHPDRMTTVHSAHLSLSSIEVIFTGKASHAAGSPWEGLNALDAAVTAYQSVSNLRQQMRPDWRVHGIVKEGGQRPNIIPERAVLEYCTRASTGGDSQLLLNKVKQCMHAAAMATGCECLISESEPEYKNVIPNRALAGAYSANLRALGVEHTQLYPEPTGSTDMGNVSYEVPSIHPMFFIGGDAATHSAGFAVLAGAAEAQRYVLEQAKALAMTGIDVLTEPALQLKDVAAAKIDESRELLLGVSSRLWQNPELALEERMAHQLLTETLESSGFSVTRHFVLDTGFKAEFGSAGAGRPHIAVMCEFDALPGIGHACGHNLIAEVAVGAGLGIKAAMEAGGVAGRVTVLGTPAEEHYGGKINFIEAGFFKDVDVALMAHPYKLTAVHVPHLSVAFLRATYTGKASHAAGSPWEGLNALDAAVTAYQSVSNLRQQMRPEWRVHGIVKEGGQRPNIIPERAV